jgi:hypothetical protein
MLQNAPTKLEKYDMPGIDEKGISTAGRRQRCMVQGH